MSDPIHIISLGAGVQSSTLALMAARGEVGPMPNCAIFADTGDEPASVYRWLDCLEKMLPFSVHRVSAGVLSKEALRIRVSKKTGLPYMKGKIPAFTKAPDGSMGILGRQCTMEHKIIPLVRKAREIAKPKRGEKEVKVVMWLGISRDEAHRMKPSRNPWIEHRWPLIDMEMTRADCTRWWYANGGGLMPPRSACRYCPFHGDAEWQRLKTEEPAEFAMAVQFEKQLQATAAQVPRMNGVPYLTRRCVPLETIDFTEDQRGRQQMELFGNECEGLCGV